MFVAVVGGNAIVEPAQVTARRLRGRPRGGSERYRKGGVVPQQAWNAKRERQYRHIKDSAQQRGVGEERAKEIAARTVNKNRARAGESDQASRTSTQDVSPQHRGGKRSHSGSRGRTKAQLYQDAKRHGVHGRSQMTKAELERALSD
jgi:hypothetical protein